MSYYTAKAEMDSGKIVSFDYEHGLLFDISPLSGAAVEINKSQGYNQLGETVESLSMAGISRTIRGTCLTVDAAQTLIRAFAPFSSGRLSVNGYFCDFVTQKTPQIYMKNGRRKFSLQIYCALPYWQNESASFYSIGTLTPTFSFPAMFNSHQFGTRDDTGYVNGINDGSIRVPIEVTITAEGDVQNPGVVNIRTGEELKLSGTIPGGDSVHIYRDENGELIVELMHDGVTTDALGLFDSASTLYYINPGDNLLRMTKTAGGPVTTVVSFRSADMGVVI